MNTVLPVLSTDFRLRVQETLRICEGDNLHMLPYCTLRTCEEQARLFRKTRTLQEIRQKQQSLRDRKLPFLADVLDVVGPQAGELGRHVTKAGPGESWHNYGLAVDCVPLKDGKAVWEESAPEWKTYGEAARIAGLQWAGTWQDFREMPHIQSLPFPNPITHYKDPAKIKEMLLLAGSLKRV